MTNLQRTYKEPNYHPNTTEVALHIRQGSPGATFEIITPEQARYLLPLEPKLFQLIGLKKTIKQIEKSMERFAKDEINHITIEHENGFWFPTPETNPDTFKMIVVEKHIRRNRQPQQSGSDSTTLEKRRWENFSELIKMKRQRVL